MIGPGALRIPALLLLLLVSRTGPGPLHITLDTSGHERCVAAVVGAASQHVHPSLRRRISTCAALPVRGISDPFSQHLHMYGTMPNTRPAREGTIPSDEADLRFMDDRPLSP